MPGAGLRWHRARPCAQALSCPTCRLQELYYEIVHVLNLMLEDLPQKKRSLSSAKIDEK